MASNNQCTIIDKIYDEEYDLFSKHQAILETSPFGRSIRLWLGLHGHRILCALFEQQAGEFVLYVEGTGVEYGNRSEIIKLARQTINFYNTPD